MRQILDFGFVLRIGLLALCLLSGSSLSAQTSDFRASQLPPTSNQRNLEFPPAGYLNDRIPPGEGIKQAGHIDSELFHRSPVPVAGEPAAKASNLASTVGHWKDVIVQQSSKVFGSSSGSSPDFKRVFASLAIVVGGYFGLVWLMRMINPQRNSQLPRDVVEVLGKTPFGPKQNLQLVRLGNKLILMLEGNDIVQPIAEISDPVEVHQVLSLCEPKYRSRNKRLSNSGLTPTTPALSPINRNNLLNSNSDSGQATLTDLVRVIETATRQNVTRRTSFEG